MTLVANIEAALAAWTTAAAQALDGLAGRLRRGRHVRVVWDRTDTLNFSLLRQPSSKPRLQDTTLRLADGRPERSLPAAWLASAAGQHHRMPFGVRSGPVPAARLPKQASGFLDGIVRSQIDRLTPWAAGDAVFGFNAPREVANERLELTLAATSRTALMPLVQLADRVGAAALTVSVEAEADGKAEPESISVFAVGLRSAIAGEHDLAKVLRYALLGVAGATALTLVASMVIGNSLDGEMQDVQARIARQRAALRANTGAGGVSAKSQLARRQQTTPAAVLVLDAV